MGRRKAAGSVARQGAGIGGMARDCPRSRLRERVGVRARCYDLADDPRPLRLPHPHPALSRKRERVVVPDGTYIRTILPGFMMLSGSSAFLTRRMTLSASPCSSWRQSILPY